MSERSFEASDAKARSGRNTRLRERGFALLGDPAGCGRGWRASGTGDGYINTVQMHAPAFLAVDVPRPPPFPRPLMRLATVRPLAGSSPWSRAVLLNCLRFSREDNESLLATRKGVALTAVRMRGAVS